MGRRHPVLVRSLQIAAKRLGVRTGPWELGSGAHHTVTSVASSETYLVRSTVQIPSLAKLPLDHLADSGPPAQPRWG